MRWPVGRRAIGLVAVACSALAVVTGCRHSQLPSIGYATDAVPASYNGGSTLGASSGAAALFGRVVTGFFYTGPAGQPMADTDFGTAAQIPGDAQTIAYRINPDAVYSDGVPISCDDLVLEWAARSGKFTKRAAAGQVPLFDAASTVGYSDILRVDCAPGSRDATVVFKSEQSYLPWRTLFNATDLMPAHVAAQAAGVPNVVAAVQTADPAVMARLADFWNTGWLLKPGAVDAKTFPSSGPYRIESYSATDGLVLVRNEHWWGMPARTPRIVVWPKGSDLAKAASDKSLDAVDVGAGAVKDLDLPGFSIEQVPSRGIEQLILGSSGVFARTDVRRALALCVPRQALFDRFGHPGAGPPKMGLGAGEVNSRLVQEDSVFYPAVISGSEKYREGDAAAAGQLLGSAKSDTTVRIGYRTPDDRRAQTVAVIADSCRTAGISVMDAGSPDFTPTALGDGTVDAILGGPAGTPGPAGAVDEAIAVMRSNEGVNFGRYANNRYDAVADQLAADDFSSDRLNLFGEAETLLWNDMPTVPLFATPRVVAFGRGLVNGVASPTKAGAGWNMDQWVLQR